MSKANNGSTRERLLEAAGRTFAEKAFREATVREICDRADANVAAVNYHFGGKQRLHREVLQQVFHYAMEKYPPEPPGNGLAPRERLHVFVRSFLMQRLDPDRPAWHRRLLAREMAEPSPAMREFVRKAIRHNHGALREILSDLAGPRGDAKTLDLAMGSLLGQCRFHLHGRWWPADSVPGASVSADGVDELARKITDFTVAALRAAPRSRKRRKTRKGGGRQ